jgi:hypothetical protein
MADQPAVVVGSDDRIHLVFVGGWGGQLYYSSADLNDAGYSRAWEKPVIISQDITSIGSPNIMQDIQGNLHVIYHSDNGKNQGIFHSTSSNLGVSWSTPGLVPGTTLGSSFILADTRAAISPTGVVHVTWMWTTLELFPPKGIFYKRSSDFGKTWEETSTVVDGPYRHPDVAVVGDDEVHLVWSGTAEDRYKFSRWSLDGGETWSDVIRMPQIGGFQGYSGMAIDSLDRIHLGMVASYFGIGDSLIHSIWNGSNWTKPESLIINRITENNPQNADIAISEGNVINLVVMYPINEFPQDDFQVSDKSYQFDIYYIYGMLDSPHIAPIPTILPSEVVTYEAEENVGSKVSEEVKSYQPTPLLMQQSSSIFDVTPTMLFIIAAVPVLLLFSTVFILRKRR